MLGAVDTAKEKAQIDVNCLGVYKLEQAREET